MSGIERVVSGGNPKKPKIEIGVFLAGAWRKLPWRLLEFDGGRQRRATITGFTSDVAAAACDAVDEAVDVLLDDVRRDDAPEQATCACDVADEAEHVLDWDDALQ